MMNDKYNDNELLYLISQNNEEALEVLLKKYYPLIENRLNKFNIKSFYKEDYFQECLITFFKVIEKFRDDKNGVFNLYLDNAIQNTIKNSLKREQRYYYNVISVENADVLREEKVTYQSSLELENYVRGLSSFERKIYRMYFEENKTPKQISDYTLCGDKKIYNALFRIKDKLKKIGHSVKGIDDVKVLENKSLTELEKEVYEYYKKGYSARIIADILKYDYCKVSNAISRAKYKVKK